MSGRYLLDTNVIIALFKGDENVQKQLVHASEVFVPVIAVGELYYGAQHSTQIEKHMTEVQQLVAQVSVLRCDQSTAECYGQIKSELRAKGHPIPENDVWIAALALQHSLTVVTRDQHFKKVDGLTTEEW